MKTPATLLGEMPLAALKAGEVLAIMVDEVIEPGDIVREGEAIGVDMGIDIDLDIDMLGMGLPHLLPVPMGPMRAPTYRVKSG